MQKHKKKRTGCQHNKKNLWFLWHFVMPKFPHRNLLVFDLANAVLRQAFYLCMKMSFSKSRHGFETNFLWKWGEEKSCWANMLTKAWWTQRLWEPCWLRRVGPLMELALCFQCTWTFAWSCNVLVLTLELYLPVTKTRRIGTEKIQLICIQMTSMSSYCTRYRLISMLKDSIFKKIHLHFQRNTQRLL